MFFKINHKMKYFKTTTKRKKKEKQERKKKINSNFFLFESKLFRRNVQFYLPTTYDYHMEDQEEL